jgi:hypothetical protein
LISTSNGTNLLPFFAERAIDAIRAETSPTWCC